jgi:hypothetical protein
MGRYFGSLNEGTNERMRSSFGWNWPNSKKERLEALKEYKKALKEELEDIEKEEKSLS